MHPDYENYYFFLNVRMSNKFFFINQVDKYKYRLLGHPLLQMLINFKLNIRDEDPLIFGLPDLLRFWSDPDPTCNNGYIELFSSWAKYKFKLKMNEIELYAYLPKIQIFFFFIWN